MPAGWGEDEQRFAAAVETADLTGLPLSAALRRDLHVVAMLRDTGAALSPEAEASARMKARLFAAIDPKSAPREVAPVEAEQPTEHISPVTSPVPSPASSAVSGSAGGGRHRFDPPVPASLRQARERREVATSRRRFPVVGAAATLLLVAIASLAVFLSRDALPGDTLYGVKRAAENVGLGLTFDSVEKANRHLDLAGTRMNEVAALLSSAPSPDTSALVDEALQDFTDETAAASRLMLGDVQGVDSAQLDGLRTWAVDKKASISSLRTAAAPPSLASAGNLLDRVQGRAEALQTRLPCRELSSGMSDELGILPADGLCTPLPAGVDPSTARQSGEPAGLDPGALGLPNPSSLVPGANGTSQSPSESAATPAPGIKLPVPGVGKITIPPLLPGLPDITVGG